MKADMDEEKTQNLFLHPSDQIPDQCSSVLHGNGPVPMSWQ
jgi:hypothetical protein